MFFAQGFGGAPLPKKTKPSSKGKGKKGGRKKGATHSITEDQVCTLNRSALARPLLLCLLNHVYRCEIL